MTDSARLTTALTDRGRIERELSHGGMATVYLAHDLKHNARTPLFDMTNYVGETDHANYDVSPDGRSFVMLRGSQASQIQLIQTWMAQLRVP